MRTNVSMAILLASILAGPSGQADRRAGQRTRFLRTNQSRKTDPPPALQPTIFGEDHPFSVAPLHNAGGGDQHHHPVCYRITEPTTGVIALPRPNPGFRSVRVIVFAADGGAPRILLVKGTDGYATWALPGGTVRQGTHVETVSSAATRWTLETSGIGIRLRRTGSPVPKVDPVLSLISSVRRHPNASRRGPIPGNYGWKLEHYLLADAVLPTGSEDRSSLAPHLSSERRATEITWASFEELLDPGSDLGSALLQQNRHALLYLAQDLLPTK